MLSSTNFYVCDIIWELIYGILCNYKINSTGNMGLGRSLNICFHTCKMQVIVSALLLSPCCKNHSVLGKLAVSPEVLCQYKAVVSLMAFSWFLPLPEEGTQINYYVSLQGESLRDSSHPIFSCSRTTSKLWWTTVGSYSLAWPQCKLWNTPRLPSGTTFWRLKGFFSRYVAMGTSWVLVIKIFSSSEKLQYLL